MSRQTRVYIGKLPDRTTERDIERFLKGYGKIREIVNKGTYMFVVSYRSSWQYSKRFELHGFAYCCLGIRRLP